MYTTQDVELAFDQVQQSILSSYYRNCQVRAAHSPRGSLVNKELRDLKTQTSRLFNRAKMTGVRGLYKESLTRYNREIRKAKRSLWRRYCQGTENVPSSARLMRIMAKNRVSSDKLLDGRYTKSGTETLLELCRVHFPDFSLTD
jgi:hypothetical protein